MKTNLSQSLGIAVLIFNVAALSFAQGRPGSHPYCQIMDGTREPLYNLNLTYFGDSDIGKNGGTGIFQLDGKWSAAYFRSTVLGELDLDFFMRLAFLTDETDLKLPDQLGILAVDLDWSFRTGGAAFQVGARPGLYTALDTIASHSLYLPFSIRYVQTFDRTLSGRIGWEIRPSFDKVWIPILELVWQPYQAFRLKAGFPETLAEWSLTPAWRARGGLSWRSDTYTIEDDDKAADRESMTLEDFELFGGVEYEVSSSFRLAADLGLSFGRNIDFEKNAEDEDMDTAMFVRIGIIGPF